MKTMVDFNYEQTVKDFERYNITELKDMLERYEEEYPYKNEYPEMSKALEEALKNKLIIACVQNLKAEYDISRLKEILEILEADKDKENSDEKSDFLNDFEYFLELSDNEMIQAIKEAIESKN
jgi:hypothetical protein